MDARMDQVYWSELRSRARVELVHIHSRRSAWTHRMGSLTVTTPVLAGTGVQGISAVARTTWLLAIASFMKRRCPRASDIALLAEAEFSRRSGQAGDPKPSLFTSAIKLLTSSADCVAYL